MLAGSRIFAAYLLGRTSLDQFPAAAIATTYRINAQ
jgi:hypothetical protein